MTLHMEQIETASYMSCYLAILLKTMQKEGPLTNTNSLHQLKIYNGMAIPQSERMIRRHDPYQTNTFVIDQKL